MSTQAGCGRLPWRPKSGGVDVELMLLKVPEVAATLSMSRAKVYELMAAGSLRSVRVDGCRRVRTDDLVAFVAGLDERWPQDAGSHPR